MGSHPIKTSPQWAVAMLLALASGLVSAPASAQSTTGSAKTVVVSNLSFLNVESLEFGTFIAGQAGGTVTVSPAGVRTSTGGVILVGGRVQPARFAGRGRRNRTVLISLDVTPTTLRRVGGTETMQLDQITIGSTPTAVLTTNPQAFRITDPAGIFNFPLGGRLTVGANQAPGDYEGTFSVTLNYQ